MGQSVAMTGAPRSVLNDMAVRFGMEMAAFEATVRATCMPGNGGSKEEFAAFLLVARDYELNPILKEIYAYPRRGGGIQTIVSIDGWIKLINRHPQFDGMEFDFHNKGDGSIDSVTCRIFRKDRRMPVVVTEFFDECVRATDPWKMKRRMLRHKALIQCGRYAFGFSGIMDEDEAERIADVMVPSGPTPPAPRPRALETIEHQPAPTTSQRATPTGPTPPRAQDRRGATPDEMEAEARVTVGAAPSPAAGGRQVPHVSGREADEIAQREQGGSELSGDRTDDVATDGSAEDVDTLESVIGELDNRLGFANDAEEVEEAYVNVDAEARLSDFPGGVEAARKTKAEHLDRVKLTAQVEQEMDRDNRQEPEAPAKGTGDVLQAMRTGQTVSTLDTDDDEAFPGEDAIDPFTPPAKFETKLDFERWLEALKRALKPGDQDRMGEAWNATKAQRRDLKERKKVDQDLIKLYADQLQARMQQLLGGQGAEPDPNAGNGSDRVAAYEAKLQEFIANVRTREEMQAFWDETAGERDASGAMEPQIMAWRSLKQRTSADLPSEG